MRRVVPVVLFLVAACAPARPVLTGTAGPAGPLLRSLDENRRSVHSVRAVASVEAFRRGRRIAFDTVGILVKEGRQFRIEAYSPLGQALVELIWDGEQLEVRRHGEPVRRTQGTGLGRYLGAEVGPGELCALLAGTVPDRGTPEDGRAFCGNDECVVELQTGPDLQRIVLGMAAGPPVLAAYELYRADALVYRARFEGRGDPSLQGMPRSVAIETPGQKAGLLVGYEEVEVNAPIDDGVFSLSSERGADR